MSKLEVNQMKFLEALSSSSGLFSSDGNSLFTVTKALLQALISKLLLFLCKPVEILQCLQLSSCYMFSWQGLFSPKSTAESVFPFQLMSDPGSDNPSGR